MEKYKKMAENLFKKGEQFGWVLVDKCLHGGWFLLNPHDNEKNCTLFSTHKMVTFNLLRVGFARFPHSLITTTNLYISKEQV